MIFFLILQENIFCGYSLEAPRQGMFSNVGVCIIFYSTISSGVNSMAAVALEDFIKPVLKTCMVPVSERSHLVPVSERSLAILTVLLGMYRSIQGSR